MSSRHSRSRSRSPYKKSPVDLSKYPFKLGIPSAHISHFSDTELILKIRSEVGGITLALNENLEVPEFSDGVIKIQNGSFYQKLSALKTVEFI